MRESERRYVTDMDRAGIEIATDHHGQSGISYVATVVCSEKCGAVGVRRYRIKPGVPETAKQFIQMGWDMKRKRCPACIEKEKEQRRMSDLNLRHTRMVMAELEARFDEKEGRYKDANDSDDKLAKDLKLSSMFIKGVREKAFGILKPPSELAKMQEEIASMEAMLADLKGRVLNFLKSKGF